MRKNLFFGLALASALVLGSSATVAIAAGQDGGPHRGWHGHGHGGGFAALSKLNLTDAQRASVKQIISSSFAQNKTQRQAVRQQREAFEAMTPDQAGYQAAAASLAQAEASATQARVVQQAQVRAQIYGVLNASQKAQLASFKAAAQTRKEQWQQFRAQHPVSASQPQTAQ